MSKVKVSEILEELAEDNGWEFDSKYSGRGMFGRTCLSITCVDGPSPVKIIEQAASNGIFGASWDSMGHGVVVYWTKYNQDSEMDRMILVDESELNQNEED